MVREHEVNVIKRDGSSELENFSLLTEFNLRLYVNDELLTMFNCSNDRLDELLAGNLLASGIIMDLSDIEILHIDREKQIAVVRVKKKDKINPSKVQPITWSSEDIFTLADYFSHDMPLHKRTGGAHSCLLYNEGKIIFECEDIGRHNAIDKAIGYGLLHNIPLKECMIYTSGRLISEMVHKSVMAGIPVMISKAAATVEAVNVGKMYGVTLIGRARTDSYSRYC